MLVISTAASWATAIATPIVSAVGAASLWMGITTSMWLMAAPILAIGLAVAGVIAAINNFNNTTKEGVQNAQISVKAAVKVGLTEQELNDQVFASIQSSPLGDLGARIFYTNFAAQVKGDVEFTADKVTMIEPLPAAQPLDGTVTGTVNMLINPVMAAVGGAGPDPLGLIKSDMDKITVTTFYAPGMVADLQTLGNDTVAAIKDTTDQFGDTVAGMVANGTLDPATVNDNFLIPLTTYWQTAFGPTGTLATATTGFVTNFTTGFGKIDTALKTTVTTTTEQLTLLGDGLIMKKDEIRKTLNSLGDTASTSLTKFSSSFQTVMTNVGMYVTNMATKISNLITQITALGTISGTPMTGGGGLPQHETGLAYVPYDGYVASLHKGERVLTAQENRDSKFQTPQTSLSSSKNSSTTTNEVQINITGVQDVDSFVKEIRRRGYSIG
jgi:hypothetical protein